MVWTEVIVQSKVLPKIKSTMMIEFSTGKFNHHSAPPPKKSDRFYCVQLYSSRSISQGVTSKTKFFFRFSYIFEDEVVYETISLFVVGEKVKLLSLIMSFIAF